MRNAIKYYFDIDVDELRYDDHLYIFDNYILKEVKQNVDIELYKFLFSNNIYVHKIIQNKDNNIITLINKKKYMLLYRESCLTEKVITLKDIVNFAIDIQDSKSRDWSQLWEYKIDYYEKNIIKIIDKKILEVFPYYIGLSELAIRIYRENEYDVSCSICHNRLNNSIDFHSPDNIIIDYKVRDLAEYIKLAFFQDKLILEDIFKCLDVMPLKKGDYILLFARLLFPTYFYDCIEDEDDINKYISKINLYEELLNNIYIYLNRYTKISKIDWLIKKI